MKTKPLSALIKVSTIEISFGNVAPIKLNNDCFQHRYLAPSHLIKKLSQSNARWQIQQRSYIYSVNISSRPNEQKKEPLIFVLKKCKLKKKTLRIPEKYYVSSQTTERFLPHFV